MNNSIKISLISPHPVVMINTSFPRTLSWIWIDVSPLLNFPSTMFPSGTPRRLQMDLVSDGWEEPPRMTKLRIARASWWTETGLSKGSARIRVARVNWRFDLKSDKFVRITWPKLDRLRIMNTTRLFAPGARRAISTALRPCSRHQQSRCIIIFIYQRLKPMQMRQNQTQHLIIQPFIPFTIRQTGIVDCAPFSKPGGVWCW